MRVHRPSFATPPYTPTDALTGTPTAASRLAACVASVALIAAALVATAITAPAATASTTGFVAGATDAASATAEDTVTAKLNDERVSRGLPRLDTRSALVAVARRQAARMADRNVLFHNPTLTSDVTNWRWVGENVGYGPDALTVHVAFMNSPEHRANILDLDYTQVGIGAVVRDGRVWVAEVFRQPMRPTMTGATTTPTRTKAAHSARRTLRLGAAGPAVRRVQARLGLPVTGVYGHATVAAVSRFQRHLGWTGRGNCGPHTWTRLF